MIGAYRVGVEFEWVSFEPTNLVVPFPRDNDPDEVVTMTPDEVLAELHTIRQKQADLPPDSSEYRTLESRRLELSEMAQAALDISHGRDALIRELGNLEQRLAQIEDDKIEVPTWQKATAQRRLTINDPAAHASQINAAHDRNAALDRASIETRITQLKKILAE